MWTQGVESKKKPKKKKKPYKTSSMPAVKS